MFQPRLFEQILDDAIAYVQTNTDLTDFEIGSVIRTILEAAALEDDEQYFQMVQILEAFKLSTSTGTDLDGRVAEYGISRLQAASSTGKIVIVNGNLIQDTLANDTLSGSTSLTLNDSSTFPTAGYNYTIRIGEGTLGEEDVDVSNNNTSTGVLTLASALINDHDAGERVAYVSGASDVSLASGIQVKVPASGGNASISFGTVESGTLVNGNYYSNAIKAKAQVPGKSGNVGVGKITQFLSSPPFSGAEVTNTSTFEGGRNVETDPDLRDRARAAIQSLTRGTNLALSQAALGISDQVTGQRVTTANILEDFVNEEVIIYVDDGTGFSPTVVTLPRTTLDGTQLTGVATLVVVDASEFPIEGFIIVSPEDPDEIELIEYTSVDYTTNTLTLSAVTTKDHDDGDEVALVDVIEDDSESGRNYFKTATYPIVRNSDRIWIDQGDGFSLMTAGTDYFLQRGVGQLQIIGNGVAEGSKIVSSYSYYTGLIFNVQKVINGALDDRVNFPGYRSSGTVVLVETPTIRHITIRISITNSPGFDRTELQTLVSEAISTYVNGLGIGDDVIRAAIIERAMNVDGVFNVVLTSPASDTVILENELPVTFDVDGNSLITVI